MFIIFIFAVLLIWLGVAFFLERHSHNDYETSIALACVFFVVFALYVGISSMIIYTNQVNDIEKLAVIDDYITIHEENLEKVKADLDGYGELNSETVKLLFKDFSYDSSSNIDAKAYPDIPIEELNKYVAETMATLHDRIRRTKEESIDLKRMIDTRLRYKYTLVFFLPTE